MHVLQNYGVEDVLMTGCPALYDLKSIGDPIKINGVNKINFSLGVGFVHSNGMEKSVKDLLLHLRNYFTNKHLSVKFHHSISSDFLNTPDASSKLYKNNVRFSEWLDSVGIDYEDISGSAEKLIQSYTNCDLHIGYRVHAHIFMSSISKPSILIAEDGRGKALRSILGGIIFDGYTSYKDSFFLKVLKKMGLIDLYDTDNNLPNLLIKTINTEMRNEMPRLKMPRKGIDQHFKVMEKFIDQLP
jgi:hypothetical protein